MVKPLNYAQINKKKFHPVKIGDREFESVAHACRVLQMGQDTIKKLAKTNGMTKNGELVTYLPRMK
jgi:hypothetical protein